MGIKRILVPFYGDDKEISALRYAFWLANIHGASVSCLHVSPDLSGHYGYSGPVLPPCVVAGVFDMAKSESEKQLIKARQLFDDTVSEHNVLAEWKSVVGDPDKVITSAGRAADVVVFDRSIISMHSSYHSLIRAVLFNTGRPVITVPSSYEPVSEHGINRVCIAWDGSSRAGRSVSMSLPFISLANSVSVLIVDTPEVGISSADELLSYLHIHNMEALRIDVESGSLSVGEALMEEAVKHQADLLIMGAFTHHRVHQLVIGSETNFMLDNAKIPIFMMH